MADEGVAVRDGEVTIEGADGGDGDAVTVDNDGSSSQPTADDDGGAGAGAGAGAGGAVECGDAGEPSVRDRHEFAGTSGVWLQAPSEDASISDGVSIAAASVDSDSDDDDRMPSLWQRLNARGSSSSDDCETPSLATSNDDDTVGAEDVVDVFETKALEDDTPPRAAA
mmetsp:Transcript_24060/g.83510  ORF Transcript_24060/g.83510 Transcript_24060/m.83510 type:complete len:168 (-) Transcript_24060:10-513(-)